MSVTWANWFDFDRGTSRSSNAIASRKMVTNDKAEVKVEEKSITNKNVFGEAASLELSDGFVAEKKAYSPAMLMESKAAARTLKVGCKGDDVKRLQENLNTLGFNTGKPDGIFGDGTKKAVIAFQKSKGLTADGIVGAGTQNAITRAINEKNAANNGVLKVGSRGSRVTNLQNSLNALGYNAGKADGIFGTGTQNEVIRFQKTYGLTADGQVGSNTESAINKALNYKKNNILSKGQVSNDVKNLQNDLKTLGYLTGNADGAFGAGTEAAVKAFQQKHGLTADGLAGSSTRAKIADAIAEKNKPKPESNVLKLGSKGENVRTLQNNLNALGYNAGTADGQFGNNTQTAVTKFQKTYGLTADGQAGPNTLNAINQTIKYKNQKILSKGQISEDVRTLQSNLKKLGYLSGSADGVFGAGTESAVKAFQKANGLTQDGLAGEATRNKISAKVKNSSNIPTPEKPGENDGSGSTSTKGTSRNVEIDTNYKYTGNYRENAEYVWGELLKAGFSKEAAAGVMGNLTIEHGFNTSWEGDQGSVGIVQWRKDRKDGLLKCAKEWNMSETSIITQTKYLIEVDMPNRIGLDAFEKFKKNGDFIDAADYFCDKIESPSSYKNKTEWENGKYGPNYSAHGGTYMIKWDRYTWSDQLGKYELDLGGRRDAANYWYNQF